MMSELISVHDASRLIMDHCPKAANVQFPILQSIGQSLATPVFAGRDMPPFDRVAMDGIAIKWSGRTQWQLQSRQAAGEAPHSIDSEIHAIEIMTGAVLPKGSDTVIPYEHLKIDGAVAYIIENVPVKKGQNVHKKGSDKAKGDLLLIEKHNIQASDLAILATEGLAYVPVLKPFKIRIISTGDELVKVNKNPLAHQIRRSNPYFLAGLISKYRLPVKLNHLPDRVSSIKKKLERWVEKSDVLILSGGVSKGKYDYIPECAEQIGFQTIFHGVAQKPGKPFWFGVKGHKVMFGLPGNPVSVAACASVYIKPFFEKYLNWPDSLTGKVRVMEEVHRHPSLTRFLPVRLHQDSNGYICASVIPTSGSADFVALAGAAGFISIPPGSDSIASGENVSFFGMF